MAQSGSFDGMTVIEPLFAAGLVEQYGKAWKSGARNEINAVLAQADLWQDENGMNWSSEKNAPNR